MFRREMGSKRGSFPPKEGDLTCMCMILKKMSMQETVQDGKIEQ